MSPHRTKRTRNDLLCIATAILLLSVGAIGTLGATAQLGESFPGFLMMRNRVVASVGLAFWPATQGSEIFQHQIVSVDGRLVTDASQVHDAVRAVAPGTPITYGLRSGESEITRTIETRMFGFRDFMLLHGLYLLNGLALGAAALIALSVRERSSGAKAVVPLVLVGSLWALTAMDLYGPYRLFRLHAACEALLFAAALHMAFGFPNPPRWLEKTPGLVAVPYLIAGVLGIFYQLGLDEYRGYVTTHLLAVSAFGAALLALVVSEVEQYHRPRSIAARDRVRILAIGALVALSLPICLTVAEMVTGGRSPQNALTLTGFVFPASVAYALLREDWVTRTSFA
jgi:hypothetical protein